MELIKPDTNIDFVGKRVLWISISVILILIGMTSLVMNGGPNYGIDFAGGILVQVKFDKPTDAATIKKALSGLDLGDPVVQRFGENQNEFLIRVEQMTTDLQKLSDQMQATLAKTYTKADVDIRRVEMVGPQVGKDLRKKGLEAILYAIVGLLIYISWRFEFRFALGAIIALIHDVLITLSAFSVTGRQIDLPIIAAFLAIIGYSLNDTIIVYDRIRENMGKHNKESFGFIINRSVNDTLSRTLLTSGTTLLVIVALFFLGGGVIHDFAFAMLVGVVAGTYSSIYIASPVLLFWEKRKKLAQAK